MGAKSALGWSSASLATTIDAERVSTTNHHEDWLEAGGPK